MVSSAPQINIGQSITLYQDGDFHVTYEMANEIPFLHCEVENYSKSVHKKIEAVFEEVCDAFYAYGYSELFAYARKQPAKFAKMFGKAEVIDEFERLGEEYEVIRWGL